MAEISDRIDRLRRSFHKNTSRPANMIILGEEARYKFLLELRQLGQLLFDGDSRDEEHKGMMIVRSQQHPDKIEVGRFSTESEH